MIERRRGGHVAAPVLTLAVLASLWGCSGGGSGAEIAAAKRALAGHDANSALILMKTVLSQDPNQGEARLLLGQALLEKGDAAAAQVEFQKALDLGQPADVAVPWLAKSLLASRDFAKLVEVCESAKLQLAAALAVCHASQAAAFAAQGNVARAQVLVAAALDAVPDDAAARVVQARLQLGAGQLDEALATVDALLAKQPEVVDALTLKGDLLQFVKGDQAGATAAYQRALVLKPGDDRAHGGLMSMHLREGKLAAAQQQLAAMKKAAPARALTRYFEARIRFAERDYGAAESAVQQVLKVAPDNPDALFLAGAVALAQGSALKAEQALIKAVLVAPELDAPRRLLTKAYLQLGEGQKALDAVRPLVDRPAPDADALSLQAAAYLRLGDVRRAEALFARAVQSDPRAVAPQTSLALARLSSGGVAASLTELQTLADGENGLEAAYALVPIYLNRGDPAGALKTADLLVARQPDRAQPLVLRAQVLLVRGERAQARKSLDQALVLDPKHFAAVEGLAALDGVEGQPARAEQRYLQFIERQPKDVQARLALARLKMEGGAAPQAVTDILVAAVAANPAAAAPRRALVEHHLVQRALPRALDAAQAAVAALPADTELLALLGRVQLANRDFNQARTTFGKLAGLLPQSPEPLLGLAAAARAADARAEALSFARRALALAPNSPEAVSTVVALEAAAGNPDEARKVARAVQQRQPNSGLGFRAEGELELGLGNAAAAVPPLQAAMTREPGTLVVEKLYTALSRSGKGEQAAALAATWLKSHPADTRFLLFLGGAALAQQRYADAERQMRQLLKAEPHHAVALNNLAWSMYRQKKPGALAYAERATVLRPNEAGFIDTRATLLAEENRIADAILLQKRAIELLPEDPSLRLTLARIYIQAGQKPAARLELDQLAALGAKFPRQQEVQALKAAL